MASNVYPIRRWGGAPSHLSHAVDNLNTRAGERRVRIHAIGVPTLFGMGGSDEYTTVRFARLMRALCERNGGTFVGLNSAAP